MFPIYLINLDRDAERLKWMAGQLESLGFPYERFSAFTPATVPDRLAARFHRRALDVIMPADIACFASHLGVAERLLESDHPYCLVLEDDVEIECSADELQALGETCRDFDILKLNMWPKGPTLQIDEAARFRIVRYFQVPQGTGSFFLTRRGAEGLLKRAEQVAIPVDGFLRREAYSTFDIAGVLPPPIPQDRFGPSSLDPENIRAKRPRRYFHGSRGEFRWLRQVFGRIQTLGVRATVRLWLTSLRMHAKGVKRDLRSEYVLRPHRR